MPSDNGLTHLQRRLNALPAKAEAAIGASLEQSANEIVSAMKRLVPVDKGTLRNSIGWTYGPPPKGSISIARSRPARQGDLVITIYAGGDDAFYARFVEFGTIARPAHPFFFPAYRLTKKRAKSRTRRAIRKAVKEDSANG